MKKTYLISAAVVVIIIISGGAYYFLSNGKTTTAANQQTDKIEQNISATMTAGETTETKTLPSGTTAFQFMQMLKEESKLSFSGTDYPEMGFFVEEINGTKNDSKQNYYWMYYINDQPASEGISAYVLKNGDRITWKYEKPNF